jgi:hypothetical protein
MVIMTQLMIVPVMRKSAALLTIADQGIVVGIPENNVQVAAALKAMAAILVILIPVQVVLALVPVLRLAGHSAIVMQIVQVALAT